jgi:hypothetical protein
VSYCAKTRTPSHVKSCFKEMHTCGKVEHVHDKSCYTSSGNKKCPHGTHTHGAGCVSQAGPLCGGT